MLEHTKECLLSTVELSGLQVGSARQQLDAWRVGLSIQYRGQLSKGFQRAPFGDQRLSEPELLDDVPGAVGGCHGRSNGTRTRAVARALVLDRGAAW